MNIAKYIDHTLLKPDATREQISQLCEEAIQYGFASVCVNSFWADYCASAFKRLKIKNINVCSVVGFPFGAMMTRAKVSEAVFAVEGGANEIDMVMNIGCLKDGFADVAIYDINEVLKAIVSEAKLKVIIETCLLTKKEKILACEIVRDSGADFVKTSTGFSTGGATVEDVKLMRKIVGKKMGVKASGGIRDYTTANAMIDAGANRLGCSESVVIVKEALSHS